MAASHHQLFIAWVPFQRRAATMQSDFGYGLHHIAVSWKFRWLRPLEYLLKAFKTLTLLLRYRPEVLWIQLPPAPLLYLALLYKALCQPNLKIVADCHNATFRRPWVQFPKVIESLNACDRVLVHNPWVENQALSLGIQANVLHVLRDQTLTITETERVTAQITPIDTLGPLSHPWVLVPCSFNSDEPIAELWQAARQAPEITFVVTGNFARAKGRHNLEPLPSNVRLAGFVSDEAFKALLAQADTILGLTKLEGIQLSVANEALSFGRPMVLSKTQLLQDFFPKGAVYVDPEEPAAIAEGCRTALKTVDTLTRDVQTLKQDIEQQWQVQAEPLQRWLIRVA